MAFWGWQQLIQVRHRPQDTYSPYSSKFFLANCRFSLPSQFSNISPNFRQIVTHLFAACYPNLYLALINRTTFSNAEQSCSQQLYPVLFKTCVCASTVSVIEGQREKWRALRERNAQVNFRIPAFSGNCHIFPKTA